MKRRCPVGALSRALSRALTTTTATAGSQAPTPSAFPIKNVTRSNFEPALESLREHVRAADYVAIDLEMTGVTSAPWRESFEFDRYDVRYLKVKDSAEKFAVVQFGVSLPLGSSGALFHSSPAQFLYFSSARVVI